MRKIFYNDEWPDLAPDATEDLAARIGRVAFTFTYNERLDPIFVRVSSVTEALTAEDVERWDKASAGALARVRAW